MCKYNCVWKSVSSKPVHSSQHTNQPPILPFINPFNIILYPSIYSWDFHFLKFRLGLLKICWEDNFTWLVESTMAKCIIYRSACHVTTLYIHVYLNILAPWWRPQILAETCSKSDRLLLFSTNHLYMWQLYERCSMLSYG